MGTGRFRNLPRGRLGGRPRFFVTAITERWVRRHYPSGACRGRCRDNFRLCGNRRSGRLGRVGSGGLDSARQVVVFAAVSE